MKKVLLLMLCAGLGAMFVSSDWKVTESAWITAFFEDKARLTFALVCAVVLNFVYYVSAPPGVSKWFYMDFKKLVGLLLVFVVAQLIFNFLVLPN